MAVLNSLHTRDSNQIGLEILDGTREIQNDVKVLSTAVAKLQPRYEIPKQVGFPWEAQSLARDVILLQDAIGRTLVLPMMLLSSYKVCPADPTVSHDL